MIDFALSLDDDDNRPIATLDQPANPLLNAILLSLHIKRGAWFLYPDFGSRLHEINSTSDPDVALARQYVTDSLQWMTAAGLADKIDVEAEAQRGGRINFRITINGREEFLVPWGG